MERGDIYQTFANDIRGNLGAGASVVAAGYGTLLKHLEPLVLNMLIGRENKPSWLTRLAYSRLQKNELYQRRMQYA